MSAGFLGGGRNVVGEDVKTDSGRGADGLESILAGGCAFGGFADDAGLAEAAGVLEIAHEIDGLVAWADNAKMHGDVAALVDDRLEGGNLDSGGEGGFEVLHGERPTEGLFVEELIERLRLLEELGVVRLAHQVLIALTLAVECGDLVVEGALAGAGLFGLIVEGVQAEEKPDGNDSEDTEGCLLYTSRCV